MIATGPYGVVRHPMYASAVSLVLFGPLALGSWWAFLPAAAVLASMVARLLVEERYLVAHLPGYAAYREQVRFRLVPGIW